MWAAVLQRGETDSGGEAVMNEDTIAGIEDGRGVRTGMVPEVTGAKVGDVMMA